VTKLDERPSATALGDLRGSQEPTQQLLQQHVWSEGDAAIALAADAGLHLMPWQQHALREGMGVDSLGDWASPDVALIVSRRNGKSVVLAARALAGLFLLGEQRIVWTAHRYDAAMEAFKLMRRLIWETPQLKAQLARTRNQGISTKNGDESITLKTGQRISFKTRVPDGGRGLDGDLVFIDESQAAQYAHLSALLPTLQMMDNPQVWYAGSAGGSSSVVQGDLVHRATQTPVDSPDRIGLTLMAWGADEDDDLGDPATWAKSNPAYGWRMPPANMASAYRKWRYRLDYFAREYCGVGNYPKPETERWLIPSSHWTGELEDPNSKIVGSALLAIDGMRDQSRASISCSGFRSDGTVHIETLAHERGNRWLPDQLAALQASMDTVPDVVVDPRGPVAWLIPDMEAMGIRFRVLTPDEVAEACAWVLTVGNEPRPEPENDQDGAAKAAAALWRPPLHHPGQVVLTVALAAAKVRRVGDRQVLSRQTGDVDSSPFISAVFAGYGLQLLGRQPAAPPSPMTVTRTDGRGLGRTDVRGMHF